MHQKKLFMECPIKNGKKNSKNNLFLIFYQNRKKILEIIDLIA